MFYSKGIRDELLKQVEIVAFLGFFHQQREISNLPVALLIQGFGEPAVFAPSEDASASSEKDHPAWNWEGHEFKEDVPESTEEEDRQSD